MCKDFVKIVKDIIIYRKKILLEEYIYDRRKQQKNLDGNGRLHK